MTTKLASVLLTAAALTGVAAPAEAATGRHHKGATHKTVRRTTVTTTSPRSEADEELKYTVAAQQDQITELSARLAALGSPTGPVVDKDAQAKVAALQTQVAALKKQVDSEAGIVSAFGGEPTIKGVGAASGFTFKPQGRLQFEVGYTSNPRNALATPNVGFNERFRRALIGASGDLPGDFKYNFQFNFAQSTVSYEDVVLSYEPKGKPWTLTIGYFYPYNTFENINSDRFNSFAERAAIVDAFAQTRRMGIGFGYVQGDFRLNAGVFGGDAANANFNNNDYEFSGRVAFTPKVGKNQLMFAGNAQYRHFRTDALGFQYRARPFTQETDQRFVDAGNIAGKSDAIFGVEALGIFGPLHLQGEAQVLSFDGFRPGTVIGNGLQNGQVPLGTFLASNPTFWGGYAEAGYWLTGETRGFKNGKVDRTKILNGFDKGGWGGFQIVGRFDYLNLRDTVGGPNVGTQVINGILNGGRSEGFLGALNWWPIDYVRFTFEYAHESVQGGPRAGIVLPLDTRALYDRRYGVDVGVVRAQVDF